MSQHLTTHVKEISQATIAGGVPVASYLSDLSMWVTIIAGLVSIIWAGLSIAKVLFPNRFSKLVKKLDQ